MKCDGNKIENVDVSEILELIKQIKPIEQMSYM